MYGRGWTNKAQVQDGTAPTNDPNAPSHLKCGRGSKESKAQVGWGLSLNPAVLYKKQLDDPEHRTNTEMEGVCSDTLWSQSMCLKPCNQALLELLGHNTDTRWHVEALVC